MANSDMFERHPPAFSAEYWEFRYRRGGNSGSGSRGRLAQFKAEVINGFIARRQVASVVEFGAGDGYQLALLAAPRYLGVDVSPFIIQRLRDRFRADPAKTFLHTSEYRGETAELALSLDVIFHLVEDEVFEAYMATLFKAAEKYVIIYSSNQENQEAAPAPHFRHRLFTPWVESKAPAWRLTERLPNPFPYTGEGGIDPNNTSTSDFYFYEKA
jgi:hypothetical protein